MLKLSCTATTIRAKSLNECVNNLGYFMGTLLVVFQPEKTVGSECDKYVHHSMSTDE
jgi:hypothetical protein